jgi:hypothetical protein
MDGILGNNGPLRAFPWRKLVWGTAITLMAAATIAKLTLPDFGWSPGDFVAAAVMLGGSCLAFEVALRMARNSSAYVIAAAMGIGACFLLVWINGAVGMIGDEGNMANVGFLAVVLVAILGSLAARFRPRGMAVAMTVAAVAQAAMIGVALWYSSIEGTAASIAFVGIWGTAAHLFRVAAREQGDLT